jgi:RNA polymerase sigma-70 factor (ECF subfamily)
MELSKEYQSDYIAFQDELKSYIYRLVPNKQDMEDIVQETYIKAVKNIEGFRGESTFKTWVFAIATNHAKNFLKGKKRWEEDYQDNCRTATYASQEIQQTMFGITQNSPQGKYVLKEHLDYCFTCMSKTLSLEEQVCLMLKEVYGFKVKEIIEITALTEGKVKHALADSRERMMRIFESRCSLIGKQGVCYQCTELNGMFNPHQDAEAEAQKLKLVKEREKANYEQLFELRLELVRAIDPIKAEGFDFHNYMLENLPEHSGDKGKA